MQRSKPHIGFILLLLIGLATPGAAYICGNVDDLIGPGGPVDVSDLTYLVAYLFKSGSEPPVLEAANIDGQNEINVNDLTYLVNYLFKGGPEPSCSTISVLTYVIVGTDQSTCYDTSAAISCPLAGGSFYGQDGCYTSTGPSYQDNGDGTVTDLVTGLMWQQTPGTKVTYPDAVSGVPSFNLAGYGDWRLPTIKEQYSLILFSGVDPSGVSGGTAGLTPFIDTTYFEFEYGDESAGERIIDAQYWSSTEYVSTTMNGDATTFGVNFADGRIKGYPSEPVGPPGSEFTMTSFVRHVRGNIDYGINNFVDNADGTVTDQATGLMWMKDDSDSAMTWEEALDYAEVLYSATYNDWRLPTAKELQSIVDYTRSPATTGTAAIDPVFNTSSILDEEGAANFPFYWSSTTHENMTTSSGAWAVYMTFGEALGFMESPPGSGIYVLLDVHGAGSQRSDPKVGNPLDYPNGHGPQGDVVRIYNHVRCVRGD